MIKETGQITLGDKTYEATKSDFTSYENESGQVILGQQIFESNKSVGVE